MTKEKKLEILRHSMSHVLAAAIKELYPGTKFAIGPAIENGFYYDFDFGKIKISEEDLKVIKKKMVEIIKKDFKFEKFELKIDDAIRREEKAREVYKTELINDLKKEGEKKVSYYRLGKYEDLCSGPHIKKSGDINFGSFSLTKLAGAYWRGDEKNKMLTRVYGVGFNTKKELGEYMKMLSEAEKRDHRKIGKELELFMFDDEVGQGLPLWLPKGALLRHLVMDFAFNTYLKEGYEPVSTPHIASMRLWQHSGHVDFYKDSLYNSFGVEDEEYMLKPMNCPLQVRMYNNKKRSYRDLPLRWTEMGTVYRYEKSGTLHGLTRVRGFTQDDAHIICSPDQLHNELKRALKLSLYILKTFGFDEYEMNLSTRDPGNKDKFIGSDAMWKKAEGELVSVLKEIAFKDYVEDIGGAVFYGPKIDIKVNDSLKRPWQLSTIQFDFNLPARFNMKYQGSDGKEHIPFMIHRALMGSIERFIGVLIEHYAGNFPLWLSPVQVKLVAVSEKHVDYCNNLVLEFKKENIRVEVDSSDETVGNKIRKAVNEKVPYVLVIGDREMGSKKLAVRDRGSDKVREVDKKEFFKEIKDKIKKREQ